MIFLLCKRSSSLFSRTSHILRVCVCAFLFSFSIDCTTYAQGSNGFFTFFPGPREQLFPTLQGHGTPQSDESLQQAIQAYRIKDYLKAASLFKDASDKGNLIASWHLATMYRQGLGVPQNLRTALGYYEILAAHYDENLSDKKILMIMIDTFVQMGEIYRCGRGCPPGIKNLRKAFDFYSIAASHNHPTALYGMGRVYYEGEIFKKRTVHGLSLLKKSALKGYPPAQAFLAVAYFFDKKSPIKSRALGVAWHDIASKTSWDQNDFPKEFQYIPNHATPEEKERGRLLAQDFLKQINR